MAILAPVEKRSPWTRIMSDLAALIEAADADGGDALATRIARIERRLAALESAKGAPASIVEGA